MKKNILKSLIIVLILAIFIVPSFTKHKIVFAAAPIITTENATNVTANSATSSSNILNTDGVETNISFIYSEEPTATGGHGSGMGTADPQAPIAPPTYIVSKDLTNLEPYTTYYYRFLAFSPHGGNPGTIKSFTTLKGEPVASTDVATPNLITTNSARLNGSILNTSGEIPDSVSYELGYDPQTIIDYNHGYGYSSNPVVLLTGHYNGTSSNGFIAPPIYTTYADTTGLTPNTIYYFRSCVTIVLTINFSISGHTGCGGFSKFITDTSTDPNSGHNIGAPGGIGNNGSNNGNGWNTGGAIGTNTSSNIKNVKTYNATDLTENSTKFNGSGDILNSENHFAYFRYSKITDHPPIFCNDIYGSAMMTATATNPNVNGSFSGGNFSAGVNGLEPNTRYYYCAVVSNSALSNNPSDPTYFRPRKSDIQYGGVKFFDTKCGNTCTTIVTKPATGITPTSVILNGSYNSTKDVKTYLEYKIDPVIYVSHGGTVPDPYFPDHWIKVNILDHNTNTGTVSGNIQGSVTGLLPNTPYLFEAVAETNWGTTTTPNIQTYTGDLMNFTTRPPTSTPSTPTDPGTTQYQPSTDYNSDYQYTICPDLTIYNISSKTVRAGNNLSFAANSCGSNGETVTYTPTNLPTGSNLNTNGIFTWPVPANQAVGSYDVIINASTPSQSAVPVTVHINVIASNTTTTTSCNDLTISEIPDQHYTVGQPGSFWANVCGDRGVTVTYSNVNLPIGASMTASSGYFVWFPTEDQIGDTDLLITATTGSQTAAPITVHVTVSAANNGPTGNTTVTHTTINPCPVFKLNSISNKTVTVGSSISFTAHTCGNQSKSVNYFITSDLMPTGATIDPATGIFSWHTTSNQSGTYTIKVHASANIGSTDLITGTQSAIEASPVTVNIKVNPKPKNCPTLKINPIQNDSAFINQPETFYVTTCGEGNAVVAFSSTNLPTGASIDPQTGYFSWIPTAAQIGLHNIIISASIPNNRAVTDTVAINVKDMSIFTSSSSGGTSFGNSNSGNGTFGNSGNSNSPTVLGSLNNPAPALGSALVPPYSDVVRYHEGIEHVFTRQIVGDISLARIYGYQDGQNLQIFAGNLAHSFATMFGYYHGGGREIRVITPDIAAYQLGLKDGMLAVYEYYDNHLTGVATATGSLKETFEYEYYFH